MLAVSPVAACARSRGQATRSAAECTHAGRLCRATPTRTSLQTTLYGPPARAPVTRSTRLTVSPRSFNQLAHLQAFDDGGASDSDAYEAQPKKKVGNARPQPQRLLAGPTANLLHDAPTGPRRQGQSRAQGDKDRCSCQQRQSQGCSEDRCRS